MKSIVSFFNEFLRDEVNLNPTRLKVAKKGIKILRKFLKGNELFKSRIKEIKPQGSYRQGTITKPFDDSDFDVDLLVLLDEFDDWQPKDYLNRLHQEFKCTERYKDIVDRKGKSRCVTIDYESDFHIDIVLAIKKNGKYKIMNKNSNEFEDTDGDGYADFLPPIKCDRLSSLGSGSCGCRSCNLHKGTRIRGIEPESDTEVRLFHPRQDQWNY